MLVMAVFTLITLILGGVLSAVCLQRFSAARDRARGEVEEELNAKLRDDQRLADAVADQLGTDTPVVQIVAVCQRDRATLLPADKPRDRPWNWGPDDLARWQRAEVAARTQAAQRRCALSLVLHGSPTGPGAA